MMAGPGDNRGAAVATAQQPGTGSLDVAVFQLTPVASAAILPDVIGASER